MMMKRIAIFTCVLVLMIGALCSCSAKNCEHCGQPAMILNRVGDDVDGISVCDACIEKMSYSKIKFDFTCQQCNQTKLGKKNVVTVGDEEKTVCNTCLGKLQ